MNLEVYTVTVWNSANHSDY